MLVSNLFCSLGFGGGGVKVSMKGDKLSTNTLEVFALSLLSRLTLFDMKSSRYGSGVMIKVSKCFRCSVRNRVDSKTVKPVHTGAQSPLIANH